MDKYEVIPQIDGDKYEIVHTKDNFTESVGGEFDTSKEAVIVAQELAQKNNGIAVINFLDEGEE